MFGFSQGPKWQTFLNMSQQCIDLYTVRKSVRNLKAKMEAGASGGPGAETKGRHAKSVKETKLFM